MKAFIISWLIFLILLSLILTGAFYLAAHGNEFGSSTVTQTTNSTSSTLTTPIYTTTSGKLTTNTTAISTSESSHTISDYGQLGIILTIVLIAVLVIIAVLRRHYKK